MNVRPHIFLTSMEKQHWAGGLALVAAASLSVLQAAPAMAADYLIHDRYGRRIGTVDRIDRETLIVHDRYGRRVGTLTPDAGEAAIEGRFGRKIGTANPGERGFRPSRSK